MSGPCRVRVRVRVVEFSSSPTMCADFVRVGSGPCRVRVVECSYYSAFALRIFDDEAELNMGWVHPWVGSNFSATVVG